MESYVKDIEILIKAGARVVEVASYEWQRVHAIVAEVAEDMEVEWYSWSSVSGLKVWAGNNFKVINEDCTMLPQVIQYYLEREENMFLILEDFHPYSDVNSPVNIRYLREMMRPSSYSGNFRKAIILSAPSKRSQRSK